MILIQQLKDKWLLMYQKIQIFEKDCLMPRILKLVKLVLLNKLMVFELT